MEVLNESHWTDYIILIMGVIFLMIVIFQKCFGSDKYKAL
jgi:hypothetical protein